MKEKGDDARHSARNTRPPFLSSAISPFPFPQRQQPTFQRAGAAGLMTYDAQMEDNFAQRSLSPIDFFNGLELTPPVPGPRLYKSRKYRPCDFCRARQVACKIDITPPCQLCSSHGRQCTFVERPKKKRRPNANSSISNKAPRGSGASGNCTDRRMQHLKDHTDAQPLCSSYPAAV